MVVAVSVVDVVSVVVAVSVEVSVVVAVFVEVSVVVAVSVEVSVVDVVSVEVSVVVAVSVDVAVDVSVEVSVDVDISVVNVSVDELSVTVAVGSLAMEKDEYELKDEYPLDAEDAALDEADSALVTVAGEAVDVTTTEVEAAVVPGVTVGVRVVVRDRLRVVVTGRTEVVVLAPPPPPVAADVDAA